MVEPLETEPYLADDLLLGVFSKAHDIFDPENLPGLACGGDGGGEGEEEEQEELEWLSNKDAFPALETSFEPSASSSSSGRRARSKGRQRRRVVFPRFSHPAAAAAAERKRCTHCCAEETPQWRAGPEGPKTLCNACGVRYKSGRLVPEYRPARSPSFSPALHSNSHRRILEMRRKTPSRRSAPAAAGDQSV